MTITAWHWLSVGAVLITLEMFVGASFFFLWIGLWACVVALLVYLYPAFSWPAQLSFFSVLSFVTVWIAWLKLKRKQPFKQVLNKRALRYVHQEFTLTEAIQNGRGNIRVEDSQWRVEGPDLPIGSRVRVIGVDGTILKVESL